MKKLIPVYVRVPLLFATVLVGLEYFIDSGDRPAFVKYPMVALFLAVFLFLLIAIEIVVDAVDKVTYHLLTEEQRKQIKEAQTIPITESKFLKRLIQKLTRSKEIELENEVMLHHDYDGIKELDNVLPPWWVYLFYACIAFAFIYLIRYHVLDGDSQIDEFNKEIELANLELQKNAISKPDNMNADKVTLLTDAASLAKGKEVFTNACAACHKADGGGLIRPNLTDEFWINGGGIKNVFKLISEGSKNNQSMVSWKGIFKPTEIQNIASYVLSLQGSKPAGGKPAEGEKWVEPAARIQATVVTDSINNVPTK